MARAAIVGCTIIASIATSTAVVGLDPTEQLAAAGNVSAQVTGPPTTTTVPPPAPPPPAEPDEQCSAYVDGFCVDVAIVWQGPDDFVRSCAAGTDHVPTGDTEIVPTEDPAPEGSLRVRIEVETGLAIDEQCFAREVLSVLNDERGWSGVYNITFARVADDSHDLRIVLASSATTDSLCYPARTAGLYSCRTGDRVVINLMRWESATDDYGGDLTTYRSYLINHEVGHFLGRGHEQCPGPGEPAPVMMQQTKTVGDCAPNGWPTESER
jgi:hypothetical protein